jgi:hypothetical protein
MRKASLLNGKKSNSIAATAALPASDPLNKESAKSYFSNLFNKPVLEEGPVAAAPEYMLNPGHLLTHLLAHLLTHLLTHLLAHLLTHLLTHSLTYSLTHSLTHSLRDFIPIKTVAVCHASPDSLRQKES